MQYPLLEDFDAATPHLLPEWVKASKPLPRPIVLVVDDDDFIRRLLEDFLSDEGYRAIGAANGRLALERIKQLQLMEGRLPNLIISDIRMPVMDGFELAEYLQGDTQLCQINLALFSAASNLKKVTAQATTAFSYTAFIPKPFDLEQVARIVKQLLSLDKTDKSNKALSLKANFS